MLRSLATGACCLACLAGCGDAGKGPEAKLPAPAFAKTVNLKPVSGTVRVELPGTGRFVGLPSERQVPVDTAVDASAGKVRLTAASATPDKFDAGTFQAGTFEIRQDPAEPGLTELRIRDDPTARAACDLARGHSSGQPSKTRVFGLLLGDAHGRFRTRGRFSTATTRGTDWGVRDRCDGTLTVVRRGEVVVTDLRRHREVVVRAGHTFLVKAR
jgi:hypothetical protein